MAKFRSRHWLTSTMLSGVLVACSGNAELDLRVVEARTAKPDVETTDRGAAMIRTGDYGRAVRYYQQALLTAPTDARLLNNLAVAYDKLGRFDLAQRYYKQALAFTPDPASVRQNLAYSAMLAGGTSEMSTKFAQVAPRQIPAEKTPATAPGNAPAPLATASVGPQILRVAPDQVLINTHQQRKDDDPLQASKAPLPEAYEKPARPAIELVRFPTRHAARRTVAFTVPKRQVQADVAPSGPVLPAASAGQVDLSADTAQVDIASIRRTVPSSLQQEVLDIHIPLLRPVVQFIKTTVDIPMVRAPRVSERDWAMVQPPAVQSKPPKPRQPKVAATAPPKKADAPQPMTIEVVNGAGVARMARDYGSYLKSRGFDVTRLMNGVHFDYGDSTVFYPANLAFEAEQLAATLPYSVQMRPLKDYPQKIHVRLGADAVAFLEGIKKQSSEHS